MSAVQVIQLPSAAEGKVIQTRGAGRLPKTISRLHVARYERYKKASQKQTIEEELAKLQNMIDSLEESVLNAKIKINQLRGVEIGTEVAQKVHYYFGWWNLPWQEKERLRGMGMQPPEWPL